MSDLAGQMFVRLIEVKERPKRRKFATPRVSFLSMTFEEALAFWRDSGGSQELLDRILRAYRENAAAGSELFFDALARNAYSQIDTVIRQGGNVANFIEEMQDEARSLGITPASPGYLENVFRTNVSTAYGAGRFRQMTSPEVINRRPWVVYVTADDSRVRDEHERLDGLIFRSQSPEWHRIAPPNGYQCRCSMVTLSDEQAGDWVRENGARFTEQVPSSYRGSAEFNGPPTDPIDV